MDSQHVNSASLTQLSSGDVEFAPSGRPDFGHATVQHPQNRKPRDLGVDVVVPTSQRIALMNKPGSAATPIKTVSGNDTLVLVSREPHHGWYDVIDVSSGKEGWVNEGDVHISLSRHLLQAAKFRPEYTGSDGAPSLSVLNKTDRDLTLKIGGTYYTVHSGSPFPVTMPAGVFEYYATEPGVIPAIGRQEFKRGYIYTWTFWAERTILPLP